MKKRIMICLAAVITACAALVGCGSDKARNELIDSLGIQLADELPTQLSVVYIDIDMTGVVYRETLDCKVSLEKDADKKLADSLQLEYSIPPGDDNTFLVYDVMFFDRYTGKALSTEASDIHESMVDGAGTDSSDEIRSAAIDFNGHAVNIIAKCKYSQKNTESKVAEACDTFTIECDDPEYDGLCAMIHSVDVDLLNKLYANEVNDVRDVYGVVPVQAVIDLSKDY